MALRRKPSKDTLGTSSSTSPWQERPATPKSAGRPAPYETPLFIPPGLNTSASAPTPGYVPPPSCAPMPTGSYHQRPPLTPPDSFESELPKQPPQDSTPRFMAMPGTMSSRSTAPVRRTRSIQRHARPEAEQVGHSRSLSTRLKTAFKDMFKREPINEAEFERIGDRHWADED
ncbi:hypothetical protein Tdes44962_MAKER04190 [Teratosphaeria destructans]|uniref:Uncharacterized protein n=1 Tax=Teratosphaeria destructans TaxID=418781 RepID=A0A9W7W083_9PEZI|nr:hypothetical protein Tdes44962_MAKER04190 [Teratosphaeria destructans]